MHDNGLTFKQISEIMGVSRQRIDQMVNYESNLCRQKVNFAIKKNKIIRQPCAICGNTNSEAHHNDHSKPYEITWLCNEHHPKRKEFISEERKEEYVVSDTRGRKPINPEDRLRPRNFTLSLSDIEKLEEMAKRQSRNASDTLRQLIRIEYSRSNGGTHDTQDAR